MKRSVLALTALAMVAAIDPLAHFKNKFFAGKVAPIGSNWPQVNWPTDFETHGNLYTLNPVTKELELFSNTQLDEYIDATGNREKIITQMDIPGVGFAEIITFVDGNAHKAYQKIPKLEKCTVFDLPESFNLTALIFATKDPAAGITTYQGVQKVDWAKDNTYHAFKVEMPELNFKETVYFCTKSLEVAWIANEQNGQLFVVSAPKGAQPRVFTDADFDGAACQSTEPATPIEAFSRRMLFQ